MTNELTENNHFRFGYKNKWVIQYGRCKREPLDFRTECVKTAKLFGVYEKVNIFFSGGVDSEVVVNAFLEAKVPFTCIICDNGYNQHDNIYAIKYCKLHQINYKIISLDVKEFWKKELYKRSMETKCISPQFPVIMWMVEQIDGFNILGSGECFLNKESDGSWVMFEREKVATLYKHYDIHNIKGAPGFFQYTPELMLSFLENPIVKDAIAYSEYDNSYPFKPRVYHDLWSDMEPRTKYTGFEKLKTLDEKYRNILSKLYPNSNRIYKTEYNRLINILAPITIKEVDREFVIKYKDDFEKEKMSIDNNPFDDDVDLVLYYCAFVRDKVAGFGILDIFKDRQSVYSHGSLTMPEFRGMGINNLLLDYRYNELSRRFNNLDMQVIVITPNWISGGEYQEKKFIKLGFEYNQIKPKCSTTLTCKLKDIKYE